MTTTNTKTVITTGGGDYSTLSAWEADRNADLVTLDYIEIANCSGATADTTAVTIDGFITDTSHTITINGDWTPPATGSFWDTSKYRIATTNWAACGLFVGDDNVTVNNIQVSSVSGSTDNKCLQSAGTTVKFINCIATGSSGVGMYGETATTLFINCVSFSNSDNGFNLKNGSTCYNCVAAKNGGIGFAYYSGSAYVNNCLACGNTGVDFSNDITQNNYCASEDDTADDNGGTGNRINQTFTFTDYDGDNYHLANNDAGAKDYGYDYSGTTGISTDIDGQTRSGAWDIGADEYVVVGGVIIQQIESDSTSIFFI